MPGYRSADELAADHVGRRVTVRRRLDDGSLTDVIGVLERFDAATVVVVDRRGDRHEIARDRIVAARVIRA